MKLNIGKLKDLAARLNLAIEKSALSLNPKSGWIELEAVENKLKFKVSNFNYYLETLIGFDPEEEVKDFHVTISSDTFIPLVSKLDVEEVELYEKLNCLILESNKSSYTFPIIKELGKTKTLDVIHFNNYSNNIHYLNGEDLESVATVNTKGLVDSLYSKEVQQFIYMDNKGAITFTENIYVNDFKHPEAGEFKLLLTGTQANLLKIFKGCEFVKMEIEQSPTFNTCSTTSNKVLFESEGIKLVMNTQDTDLVEKFPSIRLRNLAENPMETHVEVNKKQLDKALARLMVFDKKFDITVLNYSELVFNEDHLELVSVKNKNKEIIEYVSKSNVVPHEAVIRFADLVKQLKAVNSPTIDISYSDKPALVINSNIKQVIPEIQIQEG